MLAAVLHSYNAPLILEDRAKLSPGTGEVVVRLRTAALNHRDVWMKSGKYADVKLPIVQGSDGAGVVTATGEGTEIWLNREVIINPSFGWGEGQAAQGPEFQILGMPTDGTFAREILVPVEQLAPKPGHLSWEGAAALPLAGLTAWRALFSRASLQGGERVLISGIGGGVALFGLQFALAAGAEVWVTSGTADKIARALAMGAKGGFDYRGEEWAKAAVAETGGFDVILDGACGSGMNQLVDALRPGGRLVFYGATAGAPPAWQPRKVFWNQLSILGTTMGSPGDFAGMVEFVERHRIEPTVDVVLPLERINEGFQRMADGEQFGKIVLDCAAQD